MKVPSQTNLVGLTHANIDPYALLKLAFRRRSQQLLSYDSARDWVKHSSGAYLKRKGGTSGFAAHENPADGARGIHSNVACLVSSLLLPGRGVQHKCIISLH